jgi:hypothetical protein
MNMTINTGLTIPGQAVSGTETVEVDGSINEQPVLPAAVAGTLTTRTSDTAGIITVVDGDAYTIGDTVGVWWAAGVAVTGDVTAQDATTVTIDTFTGDALPVQDTAIVLATLPETAIVNDKTVEGDAVVAMSVKAANGGPLSVRFVDAVAAAIKIVDLPANGCWVGHDANGTLDAFAGDVITEVEFYSFSLATATGIWIGGTDNIAE